MPLPTPEGASRFADCIVGLPKASKGHTNVLVVVDKLIQMLMLPLAGMNPLLKTQARLYVDMVSQVQRLPLHITKDKVPELTNKFHRQGFARQGFSVYLCSTNRLG